MSIPKEVRAEVERLYMSGLEAEQIARILGKSITSTERICQQAGWWTEQQKRRFIFDWNRTTARLRKPSRPAKGNANSNDFQLYFAAEWTQACDKLKGVWK